MANIAIFRINYKSDFILTLNSDAGWMTPFCIKFWTDAPSQAYFVGFDGTTYTHCAPVAGEPTKLLVQFDDHHLPIGDLKFQIGYHFTVADFPTSVEDEVINQASVIIEVNGAPAKVMLDLNGETAPEIEFSLPAYANEAQRIENEQQRIENEQQRIDNEQQRIDNEQTRQRNEGTRIENEHERVLEFGQMKGDLEQATRDAAAAAENANEKAVYAKNQGDYAKQQGDYAKQQGDTAKADHERAEEDHRIAGEDHTQAGSDHTRAGEDHTQAGSDHTRAGEDHTRAGEDHTRAGEDHTRAESDHAAVEVYIDSLGAFDISAYHATGGVPAKYADLTAALGTNGANVPDALRKGGMSVKFVQSSDNNYVQFRYMSSSTANADFTDVANWQGVDDVPTADSENLVKSGGVDKKISQLGQEIVSTFANYEYDFRNLSPYRYLAPEQFIFFYPLLKKSNNVLGISFIATNYEQKIYKVTDGDTPSCELLLTIPAGKYDAGELVSLIYPCRLSDNQYLGLCGISYSTDISVPDAYYNINNGTITQRGDAAPALFSVLYSDKIEIEKNSADIEKNSADIEKNSADISLLWNALLQFGVYDYKIDNVEDLIYTNGSLFVFFVPQNKLSNNVLGVSLVSDGQTDLYLVTDLGSNATFEKIKTINGVAGQIIDVYLPITLNDNQYIGFSGRISYYAGQSVPDAYITKATGVVTRRNNGSLYGFSVVYLPTEEEGKEISPFFDSVKIYTTCNDIKSSEGSSLNSRNYSARLYLDHLYKGLDSSPKTRFEKKSNFAPFYSNYEIDYGVKYINSDVNGETKDVDTQTSTIKIVGDGVIDKQVSVTHVSTRNLAVANKGVRLLCIGDSVTDGQNAQANIPYANAPKTYWEWVKALFDMDKIENGDAGFAFEALGNYLRGPEAEYGGTWRTDTHRTFDINFNGITKNNVMACAVAQAGGKASWFLESQNGANPFWDSVNNTFSLLSWISKYRTLIVNSDGSTARCDDSNKGTLVTDVNDYNVCEPTHVLLAFGYNQRYDSEGAIRTEFLDSMNTLISRIHAEFPDAYILVSLPDTAGTYFPELYPNYFQGDNDLYGLSFYQGNAKWNHDAICYMNKDLMDMENIANKIIYVPSYFVSPLCFGVGARVADDLVFLSNKDEQFKQFVEGGTNAPFLHPNNAAHASWAYQIYSIIKYTLTI